jgi:membrane-associated phospholipid phosphatase
MHSTAVKPSVRRALARLVSTIVHPIALPLVTLAGLTYLADPVLPKALFWAALALVITALPIALLVLAQVLRGRWTDTDVSVRRQRYLLYPFGIACMLAAAAVFVRLQAPQVAIRATLGMVTANLVNGLINLKYKVSAHATTAALSAALLWLVAPMLVWGAVATMAALLVGWSRVALGRHTVGEVVLGWGVGVASGALVMLTPWPLILAHAGFFW